MADVYGAIAMGKGNVGFDVDMNTNKKLARISAGNRPKIVIQVDTDVLHLWVLTSDTKGLDLTIPHETRQRGYNRDGNAAVGVNSGMHSGLEPFFSTNELTCFSPQSLDQAWSIIRAIEP